MQSVAQKRSVLQKRAPYEREDVQCDSGDWRSMQGASLCTNEVSLMRMGVDHVANWRTRSACTCTEVPSWSMEGQSQMGTRRGWMMGRQ